ncbi:MAG TPA: hypothetical protein VNM48_09735 [Chloroflexota bacterium]|nr:hypothetical protein [Chloroflexota bacterium]
MPKKYEDEIREILKGMDDASGGTPAGGTRASRPEKPRSVGRQRPSFSGFGDLQLNPQRLMGGALILILFAWIMQGPWSYGFPLISRWAGYVSLAGTVLFVVALIMLLRSRGSLRMPGRATETRWRGQVIRLPNAQPFWMRWRRSLTRVFSRSRRPGDQRRPDSVRW